jgi:hypothetical protein
MKLVIQDLKPRSKKAGRRVSQAIRREQQAQPDPKDGGSTILRKVGEHAPDQIASSEFVLALYGVIPNYCPGFRDFLLNSRHFEA